MDYEAYCLLISVFIISSKSPEFFIIISKTILARTFKEFYNAQNSKNLFFFSSSVHTVTRVWQFDWTHICKIYNDEWHVRNDDITWFELT